MSPLAVTAVLISALSAGTAGRAPRPVPLAIDDRGGIVLDVSVNDSGPYRFLLDTGTSRSIVSDRLARALAAPAVAKSEVFSNTGSSWRVVVSLASLSVAGARVDRMLALVMPGAALGEIAPDVEGVLGQDFLSGFNYTLDYRHARLTWDGPLACGETSAVPLVRADGRLVMTLSGADGTVLRLVPDSGTDAPILFQRERPRTSTSSVRQLRLGNVLLRNLQAVNVQRTDPNADGLLPLHEFAAVSFAAGGGCLVVRR